MNSQRYRRATSCARSRSVAGFPVGLIGPPFPPFTNNDFLSAVAILYDRFLKTSSFLPKRGICFFTNSVHSQSEDRQIQRNQNSAYKDRHDNEDERFNQRQRRS